MVSLCTQKYRGLAAICIIEKATDLSNDKKLINYLKWIKTFVKRSRDM